MERWNVGLMEQLVVKLDKTITPSFTFLQSHYSSIPLFQPARLAWARAMAGRYS